MKTSSLNLSAIVDSVLVGLGLALLFIGTVTAPSNLAFGDWNPLPDSCLYACASGCTAVNHGTWSDCPGNNCDTTSATCDDCTDECTEREGTVHPALKCRCVYE